MMHGITAFVVTPQERVVLTDRLLVAAATGRHIHIPITAAVVDTDFIAYSALVDAFDSIDTDKARRDSHQSVVLFVVCTLANVTKGGTRNCSVRC